MRPRRLQRVPDQGHGYWGAALGAQPGQLQSCACNLDRTLALTNCPLHPHPTSLPFCLTVNLGSPGALSLLSAEIAGRPQPVPGS